jgi:hypothetical protein
MPRFLYSSMLISRILNNKVNFVSRKTIPAYHLSTKSGRNKTILRRRNPSPTSSLTPTSEIPAPASSSAAPPPAEDPWVEVKDKATGL